MPRGPRMMGVETHKGPDIPAFALQFIGSLFLLTVAAMLWGTAGGTTVVTASSAYTTGGAFWYPVFVGMALLGSIALLISSFASLTAMKSFSSGGSMTAALAASFSLLVLTMPTAVQTNSTYFILSLAGFILAFVGSGIGYRHLSELIGR